MNGLLLVIVSVVLLSVAGLLVAFDTSAPTRVYFELLAFGGAAGFLGNKIP